MNKLAVIYARYSSAAQTEQSIEGQLRVCKEYAERNNIKIIGEYIDRAMTGTNDNRPEFQRMISDSEKKEFNFVLVYKFDRFSRSKYDNVLYKHKLKQNGIRVLSAMEEISNTPEGVLMEGLLEMFAEMYSKDLSQKVKRGMRESIIKGNFIGGKPLFGYKVKNKKFVIDEQQAQAVKFIFEQYAEGKSKTEIADELNKMGYKTNNGQNFTKKSLQQNILKNRKYLGEYKNEYFESKDYYPRIIDDITFEKVQERLSHNRKYNSKPKEKFLLSGKVYCGICGASLIGTSGTSQNKQTYSYYTCLERNKNHSCTKSNEQKHKLEDDIFNKVYHKILQKDKIEEIADSLLRVYEKDINQPVIKEYEKKIVEIEKQFDKITQQIIKSTNDNLILRLNKQADDLTEQQNYYKEQIKKLNLALSIKHTKEDIKNYLSMFLSHNIIDNDFKQKIFDNFLTSVYVFDNYFTIYIDLFGTNEKHSFEEAKQDLRTAEELFAQKLQCSTKIIKSESRKWFVFYFQLQFFNIKTT